MGQVNFLSDKSFEPYMSLAELCNLMGVGKSTAPAKAKVVSNALGLYQLRPDWTLPSMLEHNPLVWIIKVGGAYIDVRSQPLDIQEAVFQEGPDFAWEKVVFRCPWSVFRRPGRFGRHQGVDVGL